MTIAPVLPTISSTVALGPRASKTPLTSSPGAAMYPSTEITTCQETVAIVLLQVDRAPRIGSCRPIGEDDDARAERRGVNQLQVGRGASVWEEALAAANHHGVDPEPDLVDEAGPIKACISPTLLYIRRFWPGSSFSLATASATSPLIRLELFQSSGSSSVLEATNFGSVFILTAKSPSVSSMLGQFAANSSYVFRPSSRASLDQS
jgi:hypothetical protein